MDDFDWSEFSALLTTIDNACKVSGNILLVTTKFNYFCKTIFRECKFMNM